MYLLQGWTSGGEIFLGPGVCLVLLILYCYSGFPWVVQILLGNAIGHSAALSGASFLGNCIPSLTCRGVAPRLPPKASVSRYSWCSSFYNAMVIFFFMMFLVMSYKLSCVLFWSIHILLMSASTVVHILLWLVLKVFLGSSVCLKNECNFLFIMGEFR